MQCNTKSWMESMDTQCGTPLQPHPHPTITMATNQVSFSMTKLDHVWGSWHHKIQPVSVSSELNKQPHDTLLQAEGLGSSDTAIPNLFCQPKSHTVNQNSCGSLIACTGQLLFLCHSLAPNRWSIKIIAAASSTFKSSLWTLAHHAGQFYCLVAVF